MPDIRFRVTCPRCKAEYLVIVSKAPELRVKYNVCIFCRERVHPARQHSQTIDSFINPEAKY
jgi:hypothetical protein